MQLPFSNSSPLVWIDTSDKFIIPGSGSLVSGVVNRINGNVMVQPNPTFQPKFTKAGPGGFPSLLFNGGQFMNYNLPPITFGSNIPLIISLVVSFTVPGLTYPMSLGHTTLANPDFSIGGATGLVAVERYNDAGAFDTLVAYPNNTLHVITLFYNGSSLFLKIDGAVITSKTSITTGQVSLNQLTIGAYTDGIAGTFGRNYTNGYINEALVYYGDNGGTTFAPEQYLLAKYGKGYYS